MEGPLGRNLTIGMATAHWTSHELVSRILVILIRERLGVHVDIQWDPSYDAYPMYLSVAGCKDWQDWTCNDYDGTDPVVHFTTEFWTKWKDDSWLSDIASIDPLVHSRVVHTGVMGYVGQSRMYVWTWAKDRAKLLSNVSLDWREDLMGESALPYLTVLKDMNMTFSLYQSCGHTDFEQLLSWGYVWNVSFEYENPWREAVVDGLWNESGPLSHQDSPALQLLRSRRVVSPRYRSQWGLGLCVSRRRLVASPRSCRAKSPGDEYLENCIPAISTDCGRLASSSASVSLFPTVLACVSWWDVIKDFLYDWDVGHLRRGEDPVVVIFEWWEPDASILLNPGSAVLPSEFTAIKSADWTRSDRMQSATKGTARSEVPTTWPAAADQLSPPWARATQLVQWLPQQRPRKPEGCDWSALVGILRQPWHTFSRCVGQVLSSRCELSFNWLALAAH